MENQKWIATEDFCSYYQVEYTFINSLHNSGLIKIIEKEERSFIPVEQIKELEKFARLHYDLDINIEGLEAIAHLLDRIDQLQQEIGNLKRYRSIGTSESQ